MNFSMSPRCFSPFDFSIHPRYHENVSTPLATQTSQYGAVFSLSRSWSHLYFPEIPPKTLFLGMELGDEDQEVPFLPLED